MPTYFKPIIYKNAAHQPMGTDEYADPVTLPISARPLNQVSALADGLYVGNSLGQTTYYVDGAFGVDAPASGLRTSPYKTLDYCLAQLAAQFPLGQFQGRAAVALKAGQTYPMTQSFNLWGADLELAFWSDPQYGDFDGPAITGPNGSILPCYMSDLLRPVISLGIQAGTSGTVTITCLEALSGLGSSTVRLTGVQINTPFGRIHETGPADFITSVNFAQTNVILKGAIINMTDPTSTLGFFGQEASCRPSFLYQYGSQFRILGTKAADSTAGVASLLGRVNFIKFYPDFDGNHQDGIDITGGSPGTSILNMNWTDVPAIANAPSAGKTNLDSFPLLTDPSFGLRNYFFNLTRDQQSRPLNVLSGRLLP